MQIIKKEFSHLLLFTLQSDFDAFDGDLDVDFPLLHRLGFEFVLSTAEKKSSDYGLRAKIHIFSRRIQPQLEGSREKIASSVSRFFTG
jgi:hypothetical protein